MEEVPKLCLMCGKEGHIQGRECPLCCSVCGSETDENNKCSEFGCVQLAHGTPTPTNGIKIEVKCRDLGRPGCLETPDDRYTIRFDDLGEEPLLFCASCGEHARRMMKLLESSLATRGPEFAKELDREISAAEDKVKLEKS